MMIKLVGRGSWQIILSDVNFVSGELLRCLRGFIILQPHPQLSGAGAGLLIDKKRNQPAVDIQKKRPDFRKSFSRLLPDANGKLASFAVGLGNGA